MVRSALRLHGTAIAALDRRGARLSHRLLVRIRSLALDPGSAAHALLSESSSSQTF